MTLKITNLSKVPKTGKSVKAVIFGPYGVGKTSLLKTLAEPVLCLDFEAGLLSVLDWNGDTLRVQTWEEARDLACLICGPNPAVKPDKHYGQRHYEHCAKKYEFSVELKKYKCIFIDSITVASRICLDYAKSTADLTRNGKPDIRSAYGTMATEMLVWVNHFQHFEGVDVVFIGGLDQKLDDSNRVIYSPQVEGSKVAAELPGILDEVITMIQVPGIQAKPGLTAGQRRFVCQTLNPEGYPAKDHSGKLNVFEEAHLGKLLSKIKGSSDANDSLNQIVDRINKEKKS